ncbi:sulfite exporter TauE/SafE family protein [Pseudohoeflea coraliihabitans]|uniref:Probable membrane transporter protein n=1 Tax=Pseudohoeflea coraliihabitans TaxID=2860393 RepID=A0ABS6WLD9_9HYPH|nr:sulfite exporter TauE/SafE family protein [Pseudohoeflea sp. DP4N28-3]MBW3096773.1 sulfite exporter TauE/SafE family protein [Pseudohoeflea sp. DP4N28-3]
MSIFDVVLLFAAGFMSSVVNAIAGGGTFLTFGAMTLTGVPPIMANATSSVTQFPGYVTSALAYRTEIRAHWREALLLGGLSVAGSLAGALILLSLSNPAFREIVPWLLLAATALFAAGPWLKPKHLDAAHPMGPVGWAAQFLTSIYGGFFGAGMGIMMLAVLGIFRGGDYHLLNAMKNFIAVLIAAVAVIVFWGGGVVAWGPALVMIPAGALGGYSGVWAARRVPQVVMRGLVVAVGLALTLYYFMT